MDKVIGTPTTIDTPYVKTSKTSAKYTIYTLQNQAMIWKYCEEHGQVETEVKFKEQFPHLFIG